MSDAEIPIVDRLDGLKQPFEHGLFLGQERAEAVFLRSLDLRRLHHAWLLCGPSGVGKATFAFRVARAFVEHASDDALPTRDMMDHHADEADPVFRRVATGGHPNILLMRVPFDEKTKKFKTQHSVSLHPRSVGF